MSFKLSEKLMQSSISSAVLHVHIAEKDDKKLEPEDEDESATVSVQVTRVWKDGGAWSAAATASGSAELTRAQRRKGHWLRLDVTSGLSSWLQLPRSDLGLVVRAYDSTRHRYAVPPTSADKRPYLEIEIDNESRRRNRRNVGLTCVDNSTESRCCRHPLIVDFEAFGWDWIIAPKRYEANYCLGDCPYAFLQRYPNTHVVHLASPPGYRGPCCSPKKVTSISLLHFDHDFNIILNTIPAMVVNTCGCT